jgi:hypothetical protein
MIRDTASIQDSPPDTSLGFRKCCEAIRDAVPIEEVWERTKPWYSGKEAPRLAEVIDSQRAMAERVEKITARSSQSA